jgi:hypothetical protein
MSNRTFKALYEIRGGKVFGRTTGFVHADENTVGHSELRKLCAAVEVAEARMNLALSERDAAQAEVARLTVAIENMQHEAVSDAPTVNKPDEECIRLKDLRRDLDAKWDDDRECWTLPLLDSEGHESDRLTLDDWLEAQSERALELIQMHDYAALVEEIKAGQVNDAIRVTLDAIHEHLTAGRDAHARDLIEKLTRAIKRGEPAPATIPQEFENWGPRTLTGIRPLLVAFVGLMEDRLRTHDRSGEDWLQDKPQIHLERIQSNAQRAWGNVVGHATDPELASVDAADCANFAAFIFNHANPRFTDRGRKEAK